MDKLTLPVVAITIAIGVASNLITGILKPLFHGAWARMKPAVRLSKKIKDHEDRLEFLNHITAHPRDLFLYLFQTAFLANILIALGLAFIPSPVFYSAYFAGGLIGWGVALAVIALSESTNISAKRLDDTKKTEQQTLEKLRAKMAARSAGRTP